MKKLSKYGLFGFLLISLALLPMAASAIPVGTELILLADVSGSLDSTDFELQRDGYAAAFKDSAIIQSIIDAGGIAATLVYWSSNQSIAVGWTYINDATSSNAFASAIESAARPEGIGNETGLTAAMNYGKTLFVGNGFEGSRLVMDVSGDGAESVQDSFDDPVCESCQAARDSALNDFGVSAINALWIDDRDFFGDDPADTIKALDYGALNVIGGVNAFQMIVQDFDDFSQGVNDKIFREITGKVPEPATLLLLGFGLTGLAGFSRRKFKK